ncbi:MAG: DUF4330 domain-containing protein [Clostridia bacterium]|nr:DUF4330 domain-containing protein [Clostridia bacterium]
MEKKIKFNYVDIIIAVLVVAVFAFAYKFINKSFTTTTDMPDVTFTVEVKGVPDDYAERFAVGDKIRDAVKGGTLGVVTAVESVPATDLGTDDINGRWVISEYEGQEDAYITVKGKPTAYGANIVIGQQEIKVGNLIHIKNAGAVGRGYIVKMNVEGESTND